MKRLALWVGIGAASLAALVLAVLLAVPLLVDLPIIQALAAAHATQALGRPVRFASASIHLLPTPRVELRRLEVADDPRFGSEPFLTLERASLSLRLRPLLGRRLEFGELRLDRPLIRLVEGPDGRLNVASLGPLKATTGSASRNAGEHGAPVRSAIGAVSFQTTTIAIRKGTVSFVTRAAARGDHRLMDLDLTLRATGPDLSVTGRAVLTSGDVELRLSGTLGLGAGRSLEDATVSGQVRFETADVGPLVASFGLADVGLTGPVRGAVDVGGVVASPSARGTLQIPRAAIHYRNPRCRPPERTLTVEETSIAVDWDHGMLRSRPVSTAVAGGTVTTNVELTPVDHGLRAVLSEVSVRRVSGAAILTDFLCDGYAVSGPLDMSGSLTLLGSDMRRASGEGRVSVGRGRVVGPVALRLFGDVARSATLAASVAGEELPSPFEFESITASYRVHDGVVTTPDLRYAGRDFVVTGAGDYALVSDRLNVDLVFRHRREQMKARLTGTSAAPVLRVDVLGAAREGSGKEIERSLRDLLRRFQ